MINAKFAIAAHFLCELGRALPLSRLAEACFGEQHAAAPPHSRGKKPPLPERKFANVFSAAVV